MPNGITEKTFASMPAENKLNVLYDQQVDILIKIKELRDQDIKDLKESDSNTNLTYEQQKEICDARFKRLEISWAKLGGGVLILAVVVPIISTAVIHAIF